MNRFQPIYDIAEICSRKGLSKAVLCPGSRCAPLTLAFARHDKIETRTFSDERSAGFIALGIAQQTKVSSILVCTSGSAAYNFAPAVAEACFSNVPLLIFTADRPAEWIAQHDGQTIYQTDIFGKHVKKSFQLPQEYDHPDSRWAVNRIVNEAINLSLQEPCGPVHINAPFREPLYPAADEKFTFTQDVRIIEEQPASFALAEEQKKKIKENWPSYHHILIVCGQHEYDELSIHALNHLLEEHGIPVVGDIISNLHPVEKSIRHADVFLSQASAEVKKSLQPDLLITLGKSVISKNLKLFLRAHPPTAHWHVQSAGAASDTFQTLTHLFQTTPVSFFNFLSSLKQSKNFENQRQQNFNKLWEVEERRAMRVLENLFPQSNFGEFELVKEIMDHLPDTCNLHLANSMSVRYANFIGLKATRKNITVFANRGTSGIDGCSSTLVGHCLSSAIPNILITGDLSFFYDRNAFWHNYEIPNLRIVLLNNHGGIIFKIIDGPASLPEADEYFVTKQKLNALKLCEEFQFTHLKLDHKRKLKNLLKEFFEFDGKTKILELETDTALNNVVFDTFKQQIKKSYEL